MSHILFVCIVFLLASCSQKTNEEKEMQIIRYLALGDSYTIGESVESSQRYPVQLVVLLKEYGFIIDDPQIIAKTGWTTDELDAAIEVENPQGPFNLVSLLIGVNNQYRGRSIDVYRLEFRDLLQKSIVFANGDAENVIVLSIPDWGVTPFAAGRDIDKIENEINMFNSVNLEETQAAGARYVDITPISRQAAEDISLVAGDGLHPSATMYASWVRTVLPVAIEVLEN